jgi:hypothetical protein
MVGKGYRCQVGTTIAQVRQRVVQGLVLVLGRALSAKLLVVQILNWDEFLGLKGFVGPGEGI